MDDAELQDLAHRLRAELADVIADPEERRTVAEELDDALAGADRDAVLDALTSTSTTRAWYLTHAPVLKDTDRSFQPLPGNAASLAVYYVCPNGDSDIVLPAKPDVPPRCPIDGAEMITEG